MKRTMAFGQTLAATLLLVGCASQAPGPMVPAERLQALAVPGATRASLQAAFGPAASVRFDSGVEVWCYRSPAGSDRYSETVILFDRAGIVRKVRVRAPDPFDEPDPARR